MLEALHDRLAVLDVEGFPLHGEWSVVFPTGKKLSVIAKAFFDYVRQEARVIHNELVAQARTFTPRRAA